MTVRRSDGGDVAFMSEDGLLPSFGDGSFQTGHLKALVSTIIVKIIDTISAGLKADVEAANAVEVLKLANRKRDKFRKHIVY
jgi:hypothetical protein